MNSPLFSSALGQIDPYTVLRTEAAPQRLRRRRPLPDGALGASQTPTNKEILDAARAHYESQHKVVDAITLAGQHYVETSSGHRSVATLNAYDWKSQQAAPITPTAHLVSSSPIIQPALQAAYDSGHGGSISIGISENAQVVVGEEGGIGVAWNQQGRSAGVGYAAGRLGLDIDVAINLQLSFWAADLTGLAGDFVGLEISADAGVGATLGIYLNPNNLNFTGFSVGVGAGIGGGASIVAGYTWVF
ncbi:hypothetical protein [Endothiovibrio diazotrophicus]